MSIQNKRNVKVTTRNTYAEKPPNVNYMDCFYSFDGVKPLLQIGKFGYERNHLIEIEIPDVRDLYKMLRCQKKDKWKSSD